MTTRFGTFVSADQIEDDLTAFLKKWIATYLGQIAEQHALTRDKYPKPKYWTTTPILTNDTVSQVRYPACLIVSPGLVSQPVKRGGRYEATYQAGVCILVSTKTEGSAARTARRYARAVAAAVLQKQSLETDYVEGVEWVDERFTEFLNAQQESVASATVIFSITVNGALDVNSGVSPQYPDPLPEPASPPNSTYPDTTTVGDPGSGGTYIPVPPVKSLP
jgi:hypothetical protein